MDHKIIIDCSKVTDNKQLHAVIRAAIGDKNYIGNNLDALFDALTSINQPAELCFENFTSAYNTLGIYGERLLKTLLAAADSNDRLDIKITY